MTRPQVEEFEVATRVMAAGPHSRRFRLSRERRLGRTELADAIRRVPPRKEAPPGRHLYRLDHLYQGPMDNGNANAVTCSHSFHTLVHRLVRRSHGSALAILAPMRAEPLGR